MVESTTIAQVSRGARIFITLAAVFVAAAGISLYFLSTQTSTYFAWTIKPPATAAFLGAGYLTVAVALLLALREPLWANVRVGVWVVATGLIAILIASLLHIDKFHLDSAVPSAKGWAWSWMFLYIVLVPGLAVTLRAQSRTPGDDPPRTAPLPNSLRTIMRVLGAVMLVLGAILFAVPASAELLWPWPLTPLTARMVGSFYMAIGMSLIVGARENDYVRILVASAAYVIGVLLHATNLVRYPVVDWTDPAGVLYVAVLLALFAIGIAGLRGFGASRRGSTSAE